LFIHVILSHVLVLLDNFFSGFLLGWEVTIVGEFTAYLIDTVQHKMMMTSGEAVKYNGLQDAFG
jgi:solute carrier family 25 (adenine nucleotide translocator) protein 4/5/6/31